MWDGGGANQNLWKQAIFVLHSITTGIPLFRAIFLSKLEIFLFETWNISFWNLKYFCLNLKYFFLNFKYFFLKLEIFLSRLEIFVSQLEIFLSKLEIFLLKLGIFLSKLEIFISKLDIFLFETWYISFWNLKFWFCILSPFYFKQYLFSVWAKTWNAKQQSCQLSKNTDNIYGKHINMYWKYIHIFWKHIGTCNGKKVFHFIMQKMQTKKEMQN